MEQTRRREGGRARRTADTGLPQLPWQSVTNPYPPMDILSGDQVEAIHLTSLRILEELGVEVMSVRALEIFKAAGAAVDSATMTVRLDRGLLEQCLATAPPSFTLTSRNPARRLTFGGNHLNFGLVAGPPNVHDRVRGRRSGNHADYCDFIRLAHHFNVIHLIGNQECAPVELPANSRHLDTYLANLTYSDRLSLHRDRRWPGPGWHPHDGHRTRNHVRGHGPGPGRDHHHFGQQPAAFGLQYV